jgi:hypothetical protein
MKNLLLTALLFASLPVFSQYDPCEKRFIPALSVAWGANTKGLGGVQIETGLWGREVPISAYLGIVAWTTKNDGPAAAKEQLQDQPPFCDLYLKLGVITYRGNEYIPLRNELSFSLPMKSSPELGYAIYYAASPQVLFGIEPMYQFKTNSYGSYLRVKVTL